jgi:hypothetical protein
MVRIIPTFPDAQIEVIDFLRNAKSYGRFVARNNYHHDLQNYKYFSIC